MQKTNKEDLTNTDEEVLNKIEDLRNYLIEYYTSNKDKLPRSQDLSKGKLNKYFDIDIFFSRKVGMRRSIQVITSEAPSPEYRRVSACVALASLCDTLISNKEIGVTKEDIANTFIAWLENNGNSMFKINNK